MTLNSPRTDQQDPSVQRSNLTSVTSHHGTVLFDVESPFGGETDMTRRRTVDIDREQEFLPLIPPSITSLSDPIVSPPGPDKAYVTVADRQVDSSDQEVETIIPDPRSSPLLMPQDPYQRWKNTVEGFLLHGSISSEPMRNIDWIREEWRIIDGRGTT